MLLRLASSMCSWFWLVSCRMTSLRFELALAERLCDPLSRDRLRPTPRKWPVPWPPVPVGPTPLLPLLPTPPPPPPPPPASPRGPCVSSRIR
uniref:Putative kunitz/bovine pancreatic trypsin inhibitor domain protein n=1 Tax=Anopheles darlingi TaxID=43151 RepID=A0A2M4D9G8_ANODA